MLLDMLNLKGQVSNTEISVLINGESGSGKEMVAKAVHKNSRRKFENLITVIKSRGKLRFSNLTMAPIEKDLINKSLLNKFEIKTINQYHKEVFNKLNKHFSINEKKDLKRLCSYI